MSAANPEKALAALLPRPVAIEGTGEVVRPLTVAALAMLDQIDSPLVRAAAPEEAPPPLMALLPSLFVVCRGALAALDAPNLLRAAVEWADSLPPCAVPAIRAAAQRQIDAFVAVAPAAAPKKDGAAANAGTTGT